ncbi:MAG: hypothetical protein LBO62_02970 [Endomicrobium sp.]|jgi:hypothetical protein|nr:hypothetical protein [Endomicrobium sp.]
MPLKEDDTPYKVEVSAYQVEISGYDIENIIEHAWNKNFDCVEITPPHISYASEIKEQVTSFLNRKEIKHKYSRCDVDEFCGTIFIYFDWKELKKRFRVKFCV